MKVTYYGQSCFVLELQGKKVLFDPFISPNELASHIDVDKVEADYILVSHGHADHTADLIPIAKRTGAQVVSSFEIATWLNGKGIQNTHPMNLGGKWKFDFGTVKMVYAAHSNGLPDGTYAGTAAGFIIESGSKVIYFAGDTALTSEMKMYGELFAIDLAFLPLGDNFTMGVEDAVLASKYLNVSKVVGMHYDTYGYIKIDHEKALKSFEGASVTLNLIPIGDTVEYFG